MKNHRGSFAGKALQFGAPADLFQPASHVDQTIAGLGTGIGFRFKTAAVVFNLNGRFVRKNFNAHLNQRGPGVARSVVQSFFEREEQVMA